MQKLLTNLLVASVLVNGYQLLVGADLAKKFKTFKKCHMEMHTWSDLLSEAVREHHANGGTLLISPATEANLDAFVIFSQNKML